MNMDHEPNAPRPVPSPRRPFYWSVRRELWENRSLALAPLIVAAVGFCAYALSTLHLPQRRRAALLLDYAKQHAAIVRSYDLAAVFLVITALLVGVFYCADALYGERRERSILFWKSLPLSDRTSVLSRMAIPLVVLPAWTYAITLVLWTLMFLLGSAVLLAHHLDPGVTWFHFNLFREAVIFAWGFVALALWHAPIYAWLLLVSGWARRAPVVWALLPILFAAAFERGAFGSAHVGLFLKYRLIGHVDRAYVLKPGGLIDSVWQISPFRFLATPGLWLGLLFAAGCLVLAIRRYRTSTPL